MTVKILTTQITNIYDLMYDHYNILNSVKERTIAVFIDNTLAFYAITSERLARLLEIEANMSSPISDVTLDNKLFEEQSEIPNTIPMGKFAMYSSWQPDSNFQHIAALWGISLIQPVTAEELAAFTTYWQVEGKVFHHMQWQQKLARNIQIRRAYNKLCNKSNTKIFSEPDKRIPKGFRGSK